MKDYGALDAAIVEKVKAGIGTFAGLKAALAETAKPYGERPDGTASETPAWRVIDRRLQALRQVKKLAFNKDDRKWSPVAD